MPLQIIGLNPAYVEPLHIGTGYWVLIDPFELGISPWNLEKEWLPGKGPRRAAKAVRPAARRDTFAETVRVSDMAEYDDDDDETRR